MNRTYLKVTAAAAVLALSTSLSFPAMAAQRVCTVNPNTVIVMKGSLIQNCIQSVKPGNHGGNSSSSDSTSTNTYAAQVLNLVNEERAKSGLSPLTLDASASSAAQTRAKEIVSTFSHTRPNGSSFSTALTEAGASFRSAGENIAYGQNSPKQVMNSWMNSSGHRANIMSSKYTRIGIGHYETADGTDYWVQLFLN